MRKTTYFKSVSMLAMTFIVIASCRWATAATSAKSSVSVEVRINYTAANGSVYLGKSVLAPRTCYNYLATNDFKFVARPATGYRCHHWGGGIYYGSTVTQVAVTNVNDLSEFSYTLKAKQFAVGDAKLVAYLDVTFEPRVYQVTLNPDGGTVDPTAIKVTYGKSYGKLPTPVFSGHTFIGWQNAAGQIVTGDTIYAPSDDPADHVLTARWDISVLTVLAEKARESVGNGMVEGGGTYDYGRQISLRAVPGAGCYFERWGDGEAMGATRTFQVVSNMHCFAYFQPAEVCFYNGDVRMTALEGEALLSIGGEFRYGELPEPPSDSFEFGKFFAGWFLDNGNQVKSNMAVAEGSVSGHEIKLRAKWIDHTCKITFSANGGSGTMGTMLLESYTDSQTLLPNKFKRPGYAFEEWNTLPTGRGGDSFPNEARVSIQGSFPTNLSVVLYARWSPISYTVSYAPGSGATGVATAPVPRRGGESFELPDPASLGFSYAGKQFAGWGYEDEVWMAGESVADIALKQDEEVCFVAQWSDRVYTVRYDRNHPQAVGDMDDEEWVYGASHKFPESAFALDCHEFRGWSKSSDTSWMATDGYYSKELYAKLPDLTEGTGTVTLYAVWKDLRDQELMKATGCTNLVITTEDTVDGTMVGKRWAVKDGMVVSQNDQEATQRSPSVLKAKIPGSGVLTFEWRVTGPEEMPLSNFVFRHQASDNSHRLVSRCWQQEQWIYADAKPMEASWEAWGDMGRLEVRKVRWTSSTDAPVKKWFARFDADFGFDDGGVMTNAEYVVGYEMPKISVIPESEGYRLAGWWTTNYNGKIGGTWGVEDKFVVRKEDGSGRWQPEYPALNDVFCVHPIWEERTIEAYDVIFDKNAADATGSIAGQRWECGKEYQLPSSGFSRPRSTWLGWSDDPEATAAKWELGASVSNLKGAGEKITLYAVWTEPLPPETWELRYDANGGAPSAAMSNLTFEVGASCWVLSVSEGPTRADYNLVGWATDKSASTAQWTPGEKFDRSPQQGEVITLYAVWSTEVYTLVFVGNGATNEMGAAKMSFGGNQKLPISALKRPGYSFCGWAERALDAREGRWNFADGAVLARPLAPLGAVKTLYAAWSNNVYSVRFESGLKTAAGTMEPLPCSYDQGGKLPVAAFDDPLFACIGWSRTAGAKTPEYGFGETVLNLAESGMVTLYGVWSNRVDEAIVAASGCSNLVITASGWSCAEDYLYSNSGLPGDAVLKAEIRGAGTLEFTWAKSMGNVDDFVFLADGLNDSGRRVSGQSEVWISERWVYTNEAARYVAEWRASHGSKLLVKDVKWTPGDALAKWQLRLNVNGGMVVSAMTELDGSYQVVGKSVAELLDKVEPTREPDYDFEGWSLSLNGSPLDNLWQLSPHNNEVLWLYSVWHLRSDVGELAQAVGFNLKLESTVIGDAKPWAVAPEGGWLRSGVIGEGHFFSTLLTYLPSPGKLVFRWRLKSKPTDNTGTGGGFFEGDDHYISDFVLSTDWAIVTYVATSKGKVGWDAIDGGSILEISYIRWYPAKDGEDPETMVIPEYPDDPGGGTGGGGSSTQQGETVSYVDVAGVTHFVTVPNKWLQEYFPGEDKAEMAKRYCRSYVAGTNPTNGTEELKITSMTLDDNGIPSFTWEPDLSDANPPRKYTVYGKEKLEDDWHVPVSVLDRFFTLSVELKP